MFEKLIKLSPKFKVAIKLLQIAKLPSNLWLREKRPGDEVLNHVLKRAARAKLLFCLLNQLPFWYYEN